MIKLLIILVVVGVVCGSGYLLIRTTLFLAHRLSRQGRFEARIRKMDREVQEAEEEARMLERRFHG